MTIKDVAERSGYAVGTVSRVLNGHPDVNEKTRAHILAVVEELGFKPNNHARSLKQHVSSGYSIIIKGDGNLLFAGILEKMQSHIKAAGRTVSIYYVDEHGDEVELAVQGGNRENFIRRFGDVSCPCVLVTTRADSLGFPNLSSVSTDDQEGAAQAMGYLLDAGHRRIGIIGGDSCVIAPEMGCNMSQMRLLGCQRAFLQRGLPFDAERQTVVSRYSMKGGYEAATALLDRWPEVSAILAMSDIMAIGALRAIHDRGLRVPEDISLIGYDGIKLAAYCVPRLATIRQDADQLSRRGVDILLSQMEGTRAVHEIVPFQLIPGESVRVLESE